MRRRYDYAQLHPNGKNLGGASYLCLVLPCSSNFNLGASPLPVKACSHQSRNRSIDQVRCGSIEFRCTSLTASNSSNDTYRGPAGVLGDNRC
jgi:hypothetical protein